MIASLGIHFNSISIGPCIVDVVGSILASANVTTSSEVELDYHSEERPSGMHLSMFEEPPISQEDERRIEFNG